MKGDAGMVYLLDFCRICKVANALLLMQEEASRMLFRGSVLPLSICGGGLRGQNPVLHGLGTGRQCSFSPEQKIPPKRQKKSVSETSVLQALNTEQNKELGAHVHPVGSSQHQEVVCEPLEAHQPFCVWWTLSYSLNLKPFGQPEFQNDVYKHSMKTAI